MTDKSNNREDKDDVLNKLIRAARKKEPGEGFVRPDADAITAYLMGATTKKQEEAVISALLQSESFRREILQMAQDMDELANIELPIQKEMVVPEHQGFLKKHEELIVTPIERESLWTKFKNFWTKPMEFRIPRLYAPVLAATIVVLLVITQTTMFLAHKTQPPELTQPTEQPPLLVTQLSLVSEKIDDPGELILNTTRGTGSHMISDNPRDVALAIFRDLLHYENNKFQLVPSAKSPESSPLSHGIVLRLVDSAGITIRDFQAYTPMSKAELIEPVMAWILGLPLRNLSRINMVSDTVIVAWTQDMGTKGCVAFTYREKSGYRALAGYAFEVGKPNSVIGQ
jgi:hypothetical protein